MTIGSEDPNPIDDVLEYYYKSQDDQKSKGKENNLLEDPIKKYLEHGPDLASPNLTHREVSAGKSSETWKSLLSRFFPFFKGKSYESKADGRFESCLTGLKKKDNGISQKLLYRLVSTSKESVESSSFKEALDDAELYLALDPSPTKGRNERNFLIEDVRDLLSQLSLDLRGGKTQLSEESKKALATLGEVDFERLSFLPEQIKTLLEEFLGQPLDLLAKKMGQISLKKDQSGLLERMEKMEARLTNLTFGRETGAKPPKTKDELITFLRREFTFDPEKGIDKGFLLKRLKLLNGDEKTAFLDFLKKGEIRSVQHDDLQSAYRVLSGYTNRSQSSSSALKSFIKGTQNVLGLRVSSEEMLSDVEKIEGIQTREEMTESLEKDIGDVLNEVFPMFFKNESGEIVLRPDLRLLSDLEQFREESKGWSPAASFFGYLPEKVRIEAFDGDGNPRPWVKKIEMGKGEVVEEFASWVPQAALKAAFVDYATDKLKDIDAKLDKLEKNFGLDVPPEVVRGRENIQAILDKLDLEMTLEQFLQTD